MGHFDTSGLQGAADSLTEQGIDVLRLGYSDLIGTDRGRDILVNRMPRTVSSGVAFCRSIYGTTPRGETVDIEGGVQAGLPDIVAFPDLSTLLPIPWEPGVAHCIADLYNPDGTPSPESPRAVLKRVRERFAELGMTPVCGPELEFYILEANEKSHNGWIRYGEASGNVYVSGLRGDPENVMLTTLRKLGAYGIEVITANHEYSSGQFEINLWHSEALDAADRAHRFKNAIKEIARSLGKLATFMAKPFNDEGGSGFHIHFSMWSTDGTRALFDDPTSADGLSEIGHHAIGGGLGHAQRDGVRFRIARYHFAEINIVFLLHPLGQFEAIGNGMIEAHLDEFFADRKGDQALRRLARDTELPGNFILGVAGNIIEPAGAGGFVEAAGFLFDVSHHGGGGFLRLSEVQARHQKSHPYDQKPDPPNVLCPDGYSRAGNGSRR